MEHLPAVRADGPPALSFGSRFLKILALVAMLLWQGWMTLTLFGPDRSWQRLVSDQPIVSGRHPLHLYHGYLGAQAFRNQGTLCCYDPAFQAGYPKTPVFDCGSRPAELFLTVGGGDYRPAAYKIGLAVACLLVPLLLLLAARGAGLGRWTSLLAASLGMLIWWGQPCRHLVEAGDLGLLLSGLAALLQVGMLVQFHATARIRAWLGLFASSVLGWFAQPLFFVAVVPLVLVYYLSVGARHRLTWHLALLAALASGIVVNSFWLFDFLSYSWVRAPLQIDSPLLLHRTFRTLWASPMWGESPDRLLAASVLGAAALGIGILNQTQRRAAARLLGLGSAGFLLLAVGGVAWEPLSRLGTARLLVPALLFAAPPAAQAITGGCRLSARCTGCPWRGAVLMGSLLAIVGFAGRTTIPTLAARYQGSPALQVGLSPEQQAWVDALSVQTTPEARILWEDFSGPDTDSHWTALLPLLTGRNYLGGLDPETCIDHTYASLVDQNLAGRPLASWTDAELAEFCRHYDIGWVACRSPATAARFAAWKDAKLLGSPGAGLSGCVYQLPVSSFALKGQARLVQAECQRITLADVQPAADGEVILSLHYQTGLRVFPSRVQIDKQPDPRDPIPFVRLHVRGPVARLTITWQAP
jgi:hypothetical protein